MSALRPASDAGEGSTTARKPKRGPRRRGDRRRGGSGQPARSSRAVREAAARVRLSADGTDLPERMLVAPKLGWAGAGHGRAAHIDIGTEYLATTTEGAGLYPFVQGGGLPQTGVPLGIDTITRELVCLDPARWVLDGLTTNPGVWIEAQPGVGKSALLKRVISGLVTLGYMAVVPADVKGEYTDLARALGMQVIMVGRGLDRINPLDSGPLGRALREASTDEARSELASEVRARRQELLCALLATPNGLGRPLTSTERLALDHSIAIITEGTLGGEDPTIPDVIAMMSDPPASLTTELMDKDREDTRRALREVIHGLRALCSGPLAGMFDGPSTVELDTGSTGVSVDISALRRAGAAVQAAGMLSAWSFTFSSINAAQAAGLADKPLVTPFDEFWKALGAGEGLVDAFNEVSRLNRVEGMVTLMSTHTLLDLEALPNEHDRVKARGLMERCDVAIFGACSPAELERISAQRHLTSEERALIASWSAPNAAESTVHPARGKFLIKVGQGTRLGVPVQLMLTARERDLYETDRKDRAL